MFYKNIDVFLLPSRSDAFALTQLEATLVKTPVVVTDIPGARVLVEETKCGKIAKPEDINDLADKIVGVIKNKPLYSCAYPDVIKFLKKYGQFKIN